VQTELKLAPDSPDAYGLDIDGDALIYTMPDGDSLQLSLILDPPPMPWNRDLYWFACLGQARLWHVESERRKQISGETLLWHPTEEALAQADAWLEQADTFQPKEKSSE
jgi:hypothetical protein